MRRSFLLLTLRNQQRWGQGCQATLWHCFRQAGSPTSRFDRPRFRPQPLSQPLLGRWSLAGIGWTEVSDKLTSKYGSPIFLQGTGVVEYKGYLQYPNIPEYLGYLNTNNTWIPGVPCYISGSTSDLRYEEGRAKAHCDQILQRGRRKFTFIQNIRANISVAVISVTICQYPSLFSSKFTFLHQLAVLLQFINLQCDFCEVFIQSTNFVGVISSYISLRFSHLHSYNHLLSASSYILIILSHSHNHLSFLPLSSK